MGTVQSSSGGETQPNWRGWYGYTQIGDIEPHCVIDSLTYGVGAVEFRVSGGGTRQYGLRPLWPDAERERTYADFYATLKADIEKWGVKVPVLLYRINGKLYCRYGASRLHVLRKMGVPVVKSVVCDLTSREPYDEKNWVEVSDPEKLVAVLGSPRYIGTFEVSHERIDLHNVVPW